jgi:hypothetical protein
MQSYGKYSEDQLAKLKARNKDLIGSVRHYDEIVSHGKKQFPIRAFIADRDFDKALKKEYFQTTDGSMWGLADLDMVTLALKFKEEGNHGSGEGMRTDFIVGACPPGYHLPEWERMENKDFQPISPAGTV